jgi:hypothetical protein
MLTKQLINLSVDLNLFYWFLMYHQNRLLCDENIFKIDYMKKELKLKNISYIKVYS